MVWIQIIKFFFPELIRPSFLVELELNYMDPNGMDSNGMDQGDMDPNNS